MISLWQYRRIVKYLWSDRFRVLAGMDDKDMTVWVADIPPGAATGPHTHPTPRFVYVLEGELTLVEDDGETVLRPGDCAAFPKGTGNGHHMINRAGVMVVYLEIGSRMQADLTTSSDVDMMSANTDGRFVHKDGTAYSDP